MAEKPLQTLGQTIQTMLVLSIKLIYVCTGIRLGLDLSRRAFQTKICPGRNGRVREPKRDQDVN
jgi:hypothetical protein